MNVIVLQETCIREGHLLAVVSESQALVPTDQLGTLHNDIDNGLSAAQGFLNVHQTSLNKLSANATGLLSGIDREETKQDLLILGQLLHIVALVALLAVDTEIGVELCGFELEGAQGLVGLRVKGEEDGVDLVDEGLLELALGDALLLDQVCLGGPATL